MMRIGALQMHAVPGDVDANLARIAKAAREARAEGAALLVTPELAVTGYGAGEAISALAEPADGTVVRRLAQIAERERIAIVAGFPERDGEIVYNSVVMVGSGAPVVYRKSHLYGGYERGLFRAAKPEAVTFELGGLRLGLLICYDVEFPENVRRLALAGVQAVIVPTALPASDHAGFIARQMIAVRAFENQVFVAYVNHCGADERYAYAGQSHVAAPDGTTLAEAGSHSEKLLLADLDPEDYTASAAENTYLRDLVR